MIFALRSHTNIYSRKTSFIELVARSSVIQTKLFSDALLEDKQKKIELFRFIQKCCSTVVNPCDVEMPVF